MSWPEAVAFAVMMLGFFSVFVVAEIIDYRERRDGRRRSQAGDRDPMTSRPDRDTP